MKPKLIFCITFLMCTLCAHSQTKWLDPTFGINGVVITRISPSYDGANAVAMQPDGKIVVSGFRLDATLGYEMEVIRYNPDGTRDVTFGRSGITVVNVNSFETSANDLAIQDDGRMVVACTYGDEDFCVIRINSDGSLDSSFADDGIAI